MMTVVTGGSGSGKSAFAEDKIVSFGTGKKNLYCNHASI